MYKTLITLNQKELDYSYKKPNRCYERKYYGRVNQTLVPYLKSTSDDKKKIWVIDDDTIYQIIVTKIIQKTNLFSVTSSFLTVRME
jgi:hypothetical protein